MQATKYNPEHFLRNFRDMFFKSKQPRVSVTMIWHSVIISTGFVDRLHEGDAVYVAKNEEGKYKLYDCYHSPNAYISSLWGRPNGKDEQISVIMDKTLELHLIDLT